MNYRETTVEALLGPLNEIEGKNAPERLFVAGDENILGGGSRVSIVGSRKASTEGLARARRLARILANKGVVIVSGIAAGIDTSAHQTAIEEGGKTIGVIGTPIDTAYPKENAGLQQEIAENHLLVSQFPMGSPTQAKNSILRNRTMALFSDATVIIEAAEKSGSHHQGWEALRLGRALYISKAVCETPGVTWPKEFLNYGARVLSNETIDELFEMLPERNPALAHAAVLF